MPQDFKVGQVVSWRGGWGTEPAAPATITGYHPKAKNGRDVYSLDNGHWAYADQLAYLDGLKSGKQPNV